MVKNPLASEGDTIYEGSIPGSGRPPGEGDGNPLQCSCLGNPTDRGARQASVHGATRESSMTEQPNHNKREYGIVVTPVASRNKPGCESPG